jgi:hypothetical protein
VVELRTVAVRWVDDGPFPPFVEVRFSDAGGHVRSVVDKVSIFDAGGKSSGCGATSSGAGKEAGSAAISTLDAGGSAARLRKGWSCSRC